MAAPPPMQRETIRRPVIAVRPALSGRTIAALTLLRLLRLWLIAGDERWQPLDVSLAFGSRVLGPRLKMLLAVLWLTVLWLTVLWLTVLWLTVLLLRLIVLLLIVVVLLAWMIWLLLARRERLAANFRLFVVRLVVTVVGRTHVASLLLLIIRLVLPELLLRGGDETKIMFGVLVVVFRRNRISRTLRVASELEILFGNMGCRSANFYIRPIRLVRSRQWILMMPTLAVATAHTFVLTVSHGLLFRQPLDYMRRHVCRRFLAQFTRIPSARLSVARYLRRPIFPSRYLVSIPVSPSRVRRSRLHRQFCLVGKTLPGAPLAHAPKP
jgi:hypothetical protein